MGEPTNNSFGRATKKVQRREEDSPDEGGGDTLIEPIAPKAISLRDMVMNFPQGDSLKDDIEVKEENHGKYLGSKVSWEEDRLQCVVEQSVLHIQLMDIENDYYLAMFESIEDYAMFFLKDLGWCLDSLLGTLYKKSILKEIREMIGIVIKIDLQMDKGSRG
ncbi:hypothetical protein Goari_024119 [Gossypium aridum]|uniref:Uncharacterized protein n=1 Tax=Gossypium aridum TaxID=34290 RepID=A0A7J8X537_GOSAI|nr:hypothetical protein [Gossypium aridum]